MRSLYLHPEGEYTAQVTSVLTRVSARGAPLRVFELLLLTGPNEEDWPSRRYLLSVQMTADHLLALNQTLLALGLPLYQAGDLEPDWTACVGRCLEFTNRHQPALLRLRVQYNWAVDIRPVGQQPRSFTHAV